MLLKLGNAQILLDHQNSSDSINKKTNLFERFMCNLHEKKPTEHQVITRYSISSFHGPLRNLTTPPSTKTWPSSSHNSRILSSETTWAWLVGFPFPSRNPKEGRLGDVVFLPFQTVDVQVPCSFLRGCSWKLEIPW